MEEIYYNGEIMRIIKHGDQYELGELTCDRCGCKFAYTGKDVETSQVRAYDNRQYEHDSYKVDFISCPECHNRIIIE